MKSVQKNFRTGEIEDQAMERAAHHQRLSGREVPDWPHKDRAAARGMEAVLRQAFHAGWQARFDALHWDEDRAFVLWAKDIS